MKKTIFTVNLGTIWKFLFLIFEAAMVALCALDLIPDVLKAAAIFEILLFIFICIMYHLLERFLPDEDEQESKE